MVNLNKNMNLFIYTGNRYVELDGMLITKREINDCRCGDDGF